MNVLLLGGGGREHALAWKLAQSPRLSRLFALPGSDAIAALATRLAGDASDPATAVAAATRHAIDLIVIGPEAPLAAGVADALRAAGRAVFGPDRAAAELETSKIFAKRFFQRHGIPSARFATADDAASAERALEGFSAPVVIKADGLAAGKGVIVAATASEARAAVAALLGGTFGDAGQRLVIEEFLAGPELSLLALTDGERFALLPPARDHKRLRDGDQGPNTGGMGAISCAELLSPAAGEALGAAVFAPALAGLAREGRRFQGVLYAGLMLTPSGPRVLEFNARFGDPETQALLLRLDEDLLPWLHGAAAGQLPARSLAISALASACIVAAAAGYPESPRRGDRIAGLEGEADGSESAPAIFHAGTRHAADGWLTAGGRVLAVAARAGAIDSALAACYRRLQGIHFDGMQYRRDIGRAVSGRPPGENP